MFTINLPTVPKADPYELWLLGGAHIDPQATKGMTLGGGVFPDLGPLTMIERKTGRNVREMKGYHEFIESVDKELELRGLEDDGCFDPKFDPTALNEAGRSAWSPMHDVWGALLDDLDARGETWAGDALEAVAKSWYVNEKWGKYLIDGGNPECPYQDKGRLRTAATVLSVLFHVSRVFERRAKKGDSGAATRLQFSTGLLMSHLDRIVKHLPLVAAPQGDHLPVPHCEVFMAGLLWQVAEKIKRTGFGLTQCETIQRAMLAIIMASTLVDFGFDNKTFAYDVAFNGTYFGIHSLTVEPLTGDPVKDKIIEGRRPHGIGSVNAWIVRPLRNILPESYAALRDDAIANGWPTKQPMLWLQYCGVA